MTVIAIFTNINDHSAHEVILWLHSKGSSNIKVERVYKHNFQNFDLTISINEGQIRMKGQHALDVVWFRKAFFFSLNGNEKLEPTIEDFLKNEIQQFKHSIFDLMPSLNPKVLGTNKFDFYDVNKVKVLHLAHDLGLNIPETIITTSKQDVQKLLKKVRKIIAKPLKDIRFLPSSDKTSTYYMYTKVIDEACISNFAEYFFPSIVQGYVEKNYELRIFFCEDNYFSAAILSQDIEQTTEDFRNYSKTFPNRIIPFNLESSTIDKLKLLMEKLGLNTGSIDMIMSTEGDLYFLEVNPVGQYGMISNPCNFYLDELIADYLLT